MRKLQQQIYDNLIAFFSAKWHIIIVNGIEYKSIYIKLNTMQDNMTTHSTAIQRHVNHHSPQPHVIADIEYSIL